MTHAHTHAPTHTHTRTHARTHTRTQARTHKGRRDHTVSDPTRRPTALINSSCCRSAIRTYSESEDMRKHSFFVPNRHTNACIRNRKPHAGGQTTLRTAARRRSRLDNATGCIHEWTLRQAGGRVSGHLELFRRCKEARLRVCGRADGAAGGVPVQHAGAVANVEGVGPDASKASGHVAKGRGVRGEQMVAGGGKVGEGERGGKSVDEEGGER